MTRRNAQNSQSAAQLMSQVEGRVRESVAAFEAAGPCVKSFENRRIRVRGFVEARTGPRIELLRVGQVELLGGN